MRAQPNCFTLIWLYWYRKYIDKQSSKDYPSSELLALQQQYNLEAIEHTNPSLIAQKLSAIGERANSTGPTQTVYTINPELEVKEIEAVMLREHEKERSKELINELYSYYLNSKHVFVIYRGVKDEPILEHFSKLVTEEDSLDRNESLMESYETDNKIEGLELADLLAEFDGIELWNAKYRSIPHTFIKVKKYAWAKSLSKSLLHPCHPKLINNLPLLPRLTKYKPSIDKLAPFVSYLKMLEDFLPDSYPTIDSIFEYNGSPYVFVQEGGWETSMGVLCYYIALGDPEGNLSKKVVERWLEKNPHSAVTKSVNELAERRNSKAKYGGEKVSKGLGILREEDSEGNQIW